MYRTGYFKLFLLSVCLGVCLSGCASTAKVKALESETQRALEIAQEALRKAEGAKTSVADVSDHKNAAEKSALRAEKAAKAAAESADRACKCAKQCETMYDRMMSK